MLHANLAISKPMEKMVYRSGMQIGRYGRAALTIKIKDPMVQDLSLFKQEIE